MSLRYRKSKKDKTFGAETDDNYFRIWEKSPKFQDNNLSVSITKGLFLVGLFFGIVIITWMASFNLFISIGIGVFILIIFILFFPDNFFKFKDFFLYHFRKFGELRPFNDFMFYFLKDDDNTLFFSNKKDLTNGALRFFNIKVMPNRINPGLNKFIRALNERKITYTYQVIHRPIFGNNGGMTKNNSYKIDVVFCIYSRLIGILNKRKLETLQTYMVECYDDIKLQFISEFHHFNIILLKQEEILQVMRYFCTGIKDCFIESIREKKFFDINNIDAGLSLRLFTIIFTVVYTVIVLAIINVPLIYLVIIILIEVIFIIFIWWRESLFQLSLLNLRNNPLCQFIDPFKDITFHYHQDYIDCLFAYVNSKLLVAIKPFNIAYAFPKLYIDDYGFKKIARFNLDGFYSSIMGSEEGSKKRKEEKKEKKPISFTHSVSMEPMNYHEFDKEGRKFLKEDAQKWIDKDYTEERGVDWLNMRDGIWRSSINLSVFSYIYTNSLKMSKIKEIGEMVRHAGYILESAYTSHFIDFKLTPLKNNYLISGVLYNILKTRCFRLNGTQLNNVLFQGFTLNNIIRVSPHFSSGIPVIIPVEFQSPKYLDNDIILGKVFNFEVVEEEIRAGVSFKESKNLLIANGLTKNREALNMKIISKLIMSDTPSLIFDITGKWSKLIKYFENTEFEKKILYFRLGSTLTLDPLHSGIQFDKNNINYLDYIADSYGLAFKKRRDRIGDFKKIKDNPEMDISDLNLDLKNKLDKSAKFGNPFYEFIQLKEQFFHSKSDNLLEKIDVLKFIQDDKTVIIDLSEAKDRENQLFLAFIFLSKFVHYINEDDGENKFVRKFIVLPSAETFFKMNFIDRNDYEGKIDKFLGPLLDNGFGLIFSVEQIHKLHTKVVDNFSTIITFRATNRYDIEILKNRLNLEDDIKGGQYTTTRKSKHHIEYLKSNMGILGIGIPLMSLPIVKRVDMDYPFVISVGDKFIHKPIMKHDQIIEFMHKRGYNLKNQQQQIEAKTQKKIFEKDFGMYSEFFPEIKKFLERLKNVDKIAINKSKIEEGLKQCIKKGIAKYSQDIKDKKLARKEIFDILIRHGYLVTDARKSAGGSETLGTCFSVGPQFDLAVNELFESENDRILEAEFETLEKETDSEDQIEEIFHNEENNMDQFDIEKSDLINILKDVYNEKYYDLFRLDQCLNKKNDFHKAIRIEKEILETILMKVYKNVRDKESLSNEITDDIMQEIINSSIKKFDNSSKAKDFIYYLKKSSNMDSGDRQLLESDSNEINMYLSHIFNLFRNEISIA